MTAPETSERSHRQPVGCCARALEFRVARQDAKSFPGWVGIGRSPENSSALTKCRPRRPARVGSSVDAGAIPANAPLPVGLHWPWDHPTPGSRPFNYLAGNMATAIAMAAAPAGGRG